MMARYAKFAAAEVLKRILEDEDDDITDSDSSSQSLSEGEGDHLPEEELLSDSQDEIEVVKMNSRLELRGRPARGRFCRSSRGRGGRSISSSICDGGTEAPHTTFIAKSGRPWTTESPASRRRGPQDIICNPPGVFREAVVEKLIDAFLKFITPEILDVVVRETNREAEKVTHEWNEEHKDNMRTWSRLSTEELAAYIGLLILAGVYRGRLEPIEDLWSQEHGRPIFAAVMSANRFKTITRFI